LAGTVGGVTIAHGLRLITSARQHRETRGTICNHPALTAMWHVDNEYTCHVTECFCDGFYHYFSRLAEERYSSLDKLNYAWGAGLWSQIYSEWDEINHRKAPASVNPTQQLDWAPSTQTRGFACPTRQEAIPCLRRVRLPRISPHHKLPWGHGPIDVGSRIALAKMSFPTITIDTSNPQWMVYTGMVWPTVYARSGIASVVLMEQAAIGQLAGKEL